MKQRRRLTDTENKGVVTSRESEVERNNTQVGGTNSYYGII